MPLGSRDHELPPLLLWGPGQCDWEKNCVLDYGSPLNRYKRWVDFKWRTKKVDKESTKTLPVPKKITPLFSRLDVDLITTAIKVQHLLSAIAPPFYTCSDLTRVYHQSFVSSIQTLVKDGVGVGCRCPLPVLVATCLLSSCFCFSWCPFLFPSSSASSGNSPEQSCPPR